MVFHKDYTFNAVAMETDPVLPKCTSVSGTGEWEFTNAHGNTPPPGVTYKSGNQIFLAFDGQNDTCNAELTTWEINPPVGLCLDLDPDSPCTGTPWTMDR